MAAKNKFLNAMKMPSIDDMFSSEADRQRESGDLVTEVPLSRAAIRSSGIRSKCVTMRICRSWWTASGRMVCSPT